MLYVDTFIQPPPNTGSGQLVDMTGVTTGAGATLRQGVSIGDASQGYYRAAVDPSRGLAVNPGGDIIELLTRLFFEIKALRMMWAAEVSRANVVDPDDIAQEFTQ